MYKSFLFGLIGLVAISFTSCVPSKKLYYFYDQVPNKQSIDSQSAASKQKIQKGDRLSITVSCPDPNQTAFLNPFNVQNSGNSTGQQSGTGYLVNDEGKIEFPLLGQVKVAGLSSDSAAITIRQKLTAYFKDPYVYVMLSGKVYFINGRQGATIPISNERLTIFEAVAQSGPQDAFDIKDKVWLIREEDGVRTFVELNLNSKKIFESPYFYLHNNDLIYMRPSRLSTFLTPGSPSRNLLSFAASMGAIFLILKKF